MPMVQNIPYSLHQVDNGEFIKRALHLVQPHFTVHPDGVLKYVGALVLSDQNEESEHFDDNLLSSARFAQVDEVHEV